MAEDDPLDALVARAAVSVVVAPGGQPLAHPAAPPALLTGSPAGLLAPAALATVAVVAAGPIDHLGAADLATKTNRTMEMSVAVLPDSIALMANWDIIEVKRLF